MRIVVVAAADGLSNPTSLAIHAGTLSVGNGAVVSFEDPNLLIAHIDR